MSYWKIIKTLRKLPWWVFDYLDEGLALMAILSSWPTADRYDKAAAEIASILYNVVDKATGGMASEAVDLGKIVDYVVITMGLIADIMGWEQPAAKPKQMPDPSQWGIKRQSVLPGAQTRNEG